MSFQSYDGTFGCSKYLAATSSSDMFVLVNWTKFYTSGVALFIDSKGVSFCSSSLTMDCGSLSLIFFKIELNHLDDRISWLGFGILFDAWEEDG